MKCVTSYERRNPDTISGEILVITQRYTTFDTQEMDAFENSLNATIGSGIVAEVEPQESEGIRNE